MFPMAKIAQLEFNHEETQNKSKLKDILQNYWLVVLFKRVKVIKDKERLRNCSKLSYEH